VAHPGRIDLHFTLKGPGVFVKPFDRAKLADAEKRNGEADYAEKSDRSGSTARMVNCLGEGPS